MPTPKPRPAQGWYRLPKSGAAFYGVLPDGVVGLDGPPTVEGPAIPTKSASKADWAAFAVTQGWSPEDAAKATKAHLVDELGSRVGFEQPVDAVESSLAIGAEVPGVDLAPDAEQVGTGPSEVGSLHEDLDDDLDGHGGDGS